MTPIEAAQEEAAKFGVQLSPKEAHEIIWEFTGFPAFWHIPRDGKTPEECMRTQVNRFFAGDSMMAL